MPASTRPPDWDFRLVAFANGERGRRFRWGQTDCYSVARHALEIVYGHPVLPVVAYTSKAKAATAVRSFEDPHAALVELGAEHVPITFAQQGDLLLLPGDDGLGLLRFAVVADGRGRVLTSDPDEGVCIADLPSMPDGTTAWRWV